MTESNQNSKPDNSAKASARDNRRTSGSPVNYGVLPELIGFNLRRTQIKIFQAFAETVGRYDVTPGQFGVLEIIKVNPGLNQSELGIAMGVDRSTVVAVIDRLEDRELVVRDPSPKDRRSYALRLSLKGESLLSTLLPLVREHDRRVGEDLDDEEIATLINFLRRLEVSN